MTYNGPFVIMQFCTNGMVVVQYGPIQIRSNICRINPYTSGTNIEDINTENMYDNVNT